MSLRHAMLIAVLFSAAIVVGVGSINCPMLWRLAHGAAATAGRITAIDRSNHNTVRYEFTVDGRRQNGAQQGYSQAGSAKIGESIRIYYLPNDPSVSLADQPSDELQNEIITVGLAAILFPALLVAGLRTRKWSTQRDT